MNYAQAYRFYDKKYKRKVERQQKIIVEMWDKYDYLKYHGGLSKKDWRKLEDAQDKIIQYENEIVDKAEKLSGEEADYDKLFEGEIK